MTIVGLGYHEEFISGSEEAALVEAIDASPWRADLKRQVQHYGFRYDYQARGIDGSMRLGPLPTWAMRVVERLVARGPVLHEPDQLIINNYVGNQGIAAHIDHVRHFDDRVVTLSLLESWEMVFRRGGDVVRKTLERRSATVFSGEARYRWTHEISKRVREPSGMRRGRRISLTFRKVIVAA